MLCTLVVTFFFVTIFGFQSPKSQRHSVFKNPKQFVSSISKADEDTIQKMKDSIKSMIATNDGEIKRLTSIRDDAHDTLVFKEQVRGAKVEAEAAALETWNNGKTSLVGLESFEQTLQAVQLADLKSRNLAQADRDEKYSTMLSEEIRIDSEKATLEEVSEMLDDINSQGTSMLNKRSLLSVVDYKALLNADPDSIQEVKDLISKLIEAGEVERQNSISAFNISDGVLNDAIATFDTSFVDWEIALGAVDKQKAINMQFSAAHDASVAARKIATVEKDAANELLEREQALLDKETERLGGENDINNEILVLLDTL